jgi:hypothetical protein
MRWIVEASVNSRTGRPMDPPAIISPSAPTEKSPDTEFTSRVQPLQRRDEDAVVEARNQLVDRRRARLHDQYLAPTPGSDRALRSAEAVERVAVRRAV